MNPENLFDIEFTELKMENSKLPTYLFEEIESELINIIIDESSPEEETDGAFELIRNIVDNVRSEIENFVESEDLKKFFYVLIKVFTLLLNIKVDNTEQIINIVKLAISSILKKIGRTKLGPKRTKIWRWTPREPYGKYKIKTIFPEQKTIQI